jgi:uncharacterized protein YcnI
MWKLVIPGGVISIVTIFSSSMAAAHVVVRPAEVLTAQHQTFTVRVPSERDIATTSIKLEIPKNVTNVTPTVKPGWHITIEKAGSNENEVVTAIIWSGGVIDGGFRDEFTFSAKTPETATELQWKAYQTYADGTIVAWDQVGSSSGHGASKHTGPFSVTKVVTETEAAAAIKSAEQAANDAKTTATRALYIAVAGIFIGLIGVYRSTRKTA